MPAAALSLRGCRLDEYVREHFRNSLLDFATGSPMETPPSLLRVEAVGAVLKALQERSDSSGLQALRDAVESKLVASGLSSNAEYEIAITNGATGGLQAALFAAVGHGDEVLVPVPGYPVFDAIRLAGATPVAVALEAPSWTLRPEALLSAITPRTRAIYINQPSNPTGRVLTAFEVALVRSVCLERKLYVIEDATYEEIYFAKQPVALGSEDRISERVIRVGSFSKTYNVPGWRLGYVVGLGDVGRRVRRVSETVTGGICTPLQEAMVAASFATLIDLDAMRTRYRKVRDCFVSVLNRFGFQFERPDGGIYVFANCPAGLGPEDLLRKGVATMPGWLFYPDEGRHSSRTRFCFTRPRARLGELRAVFCRSVVAEVGPDTTCRGRGSVA